MFLTVFFVLLAVVLLVGMIAATDSFASRNYTIGFCVSVLAILVTKIV